MNLDIERGFGSLTAGMHLYNCRTMFHTNANACCKFVQFVFEVPELRFPWCIWRFPSSAGLANFPECGTWGVEPGVLVPQDEIE